MCKKCDEKRKKDELLVTIAASLGHVPEYKSVTMDDQYICSCGWKGQGFWDLPEYAWEEWLKHAREVIDLGQKRIEFS